MISVDESRSAEVSAELITSVRNATAAVERHQEKRGYRDVTGLVQFFADPLAMS